MKSSTDDRLIQTYKMALKKCPKEVKIYLKKQQIFTYLYLVFEVSGKKYQKYCNCEVSESGIWKALEKAHLVKDALKTYYYASEFWEWYETTILELKPLTITSIPTFAESIEKVEQEYWSKIDHRNKKKRDRNDSSYQSTWIRNYESFYKFLPVKKQFNIQDIKEVLKNFEEGTKQYISCIHALTKLAYLSNQTKVLDFLNGLNNIQTVYNDLQTISLEEWLIFREKNLNKKRVVENTFQWDWIFSMQIVYGLRISEVWAVENIDKDFISKDGTVIFALNNSENKDNIIVLTEKTKFGTRIKTGSRLCVPFIPPTYPNLIEILDIKNPKYPIFKLPIDAKKLQEIFSNRARSTLLQWNAPITQTHAFRHLANLNGIQAGIPLEVRALSLGHSAQMNESVYKKRAATKTTVELLTKFKI